jgi:hypothetical protein
MTDEGKPQNPQFCSDLAAVNVQLARLDERFHSIRREIRQAEVVQANALAISSTELGRRLELLNESHSRADRMQGEFMTKEAFALYVDRMVEKAEGVDDRLKTAEQWRAEMQGRMWVIGVVVVTISTGIALLARFL